MRIVNAITTRSAHRLNVPYSKAIAAAILTLLLLATWTLLHRYKGLSQDGELYAFQAMARLNPALRTDVYLMADSQDEFTLFSPLYALFIRGFGLWNASVVLFACCTLTFFAAIWLVARTLWDETSAWAAAAMCIVVAGGYGAYNVFTYSEAYLTARSMAEAMVVVALACHFRGLELCSWTIAVASMFIHPLMALPGVLLLICLSVPLGYAALGALSGVLATSLIAWLALHTDHGPHFLTIIKGSWLEMVRQRSQYLFLQNWRWRDWDAHLRPMLCLTLYALAAEQPRVRRLCLSGMLVGVTGLIVAMIASSVGPVAILIQGQAWRWFWVTGLLSVLVLAPTTMRLWREPGCGSICAVLLVAGWTFSPVDGTYLAAAALGLWCLRRHVRPESQMLLQGIAYAMIAVILAWTVANIGSLCTTPPVELRGEPLFIERLRSVYSLEIPALAVIGLALQWLRWNPGIGSSGIMAALLLALCIFTTHGSFNRRFAFDTSAGIKALAGWRAVIPPTSTVLVVPSTKAAGFIWFTLQRPSYLTQDQSAGVVFSEATAREVRRRSEVLLPIEDPDWKIMSQLERAETENDKRGTQPEKTIPLTAKKLSAICSDAQLGFVIARERLGMDEILSSEPGQWKNWNLYACSRVRQLASALPHDAE